MSVTQPLWWTHALKLLQHFRVHPEMSCEGSKEIAVQILLQERRSLSQTRKLWLPKLQADRLGLSD